jgi:hypothetical protein
MWDKILVGVIGLATGGIGSLLAPWANWQIEKRRNNHEARKTLITNAEKMIIDY